MLVGDLNELLVALAPGALVRDKREVGVARLAELADLATVVVLVVDEELLRVVVDLDVNLFTKGHRVTVHAFEYY